MRIGVQKVHQAFLRPSVIEVPVMITREPAGLYQCDRKLLPERETVNLCLVSARDLRSWPHDSKREQSERRALQLDPWCYEEIFLE